MMGKGLVDPFGWNDEALNTDMYNWSMVYASWANGRHTRKGVFNYTLRSARGGMAFNVFAGKEQIVEHALRWQLGPNEVDYICSILAPMARDWENNQAAFRSYLAGMRITGQIYMVPEGKVLGPRTFALKYVGNINEARILETYILAAANHQTRICTAGVQVVEALHGTGLTLIDNSAEASRTDRLFEGGTRRAFNLQAALYAARALYLAGFDATSNTKAGYVLGIPVRGTMAHNWVQEFQHPGISPTAAELEAFRAWNNAFVTGSYLLDTVDTRRSGIPNAITAGLELEASGGRLVSARIDSGDIAFDSRVAYEQFRGAGLGHVEITGSSDLTAEVASHIKFLQHGCVTSWLFGTKVETPDPLDGVFKLVAAEHEGALAPVIKRSGNPVKTTDPGDQKLVEIFVGSEADKAASRHKATLITLADETTNPAEDLYIFDPFHPELNQTIPGGTYYVEEPLQLVYDGGKVDPNLFPSLTEIRQYLRFELDRLYPQYRRLLNPQTMKVDLSQKLYDLKTTMLRQT